MTRARARAALAAAKARGVRLGANGAALAAQHKIDATAHALALQDAITAATNAGARTTRQIADHLNSIGLPSRQGGADIPRVSRARSGG